MKGRRCLGNGGRCRDGLAYPCTSGINQRRSGQGERMPHTTMLSGFVMLPAFVDCQSSARRSLHLHQCSRRCTYRKSELGGKAGKGRSVPPLVHCCRQRTPSCVASSSARAHRENSAGSTACKNRGTLTEQPWAVHSSYTTLQPASWARLGRARAEKAHSTGIEE